MPKKNPTLREIIMELEEAERDISKLPIFILELPCGCKRKRTDRQFVIEFDGQHWRHFVPADSGHKLNIF